jgi:hypothetical protein
LTRKARAAAPGRRDVRVLGLILFFILFFLGFGLLPLWASAAYVYLESLRTTQAEYWAAAPWLVIAAIPLCGITLAIAAITTVVFFATGGDRSLKRAIACFSIMSLLVVVGAGIYWNWRTTREANIEAEKAAARIYVERNREVAGAIPGRIRAGLSISMPARDGLAVRYIYYVYPEHDLGAATAVFAVVDVSRGSGATEFRVACVVSKADFKRRTDVPGADPCRG